MSGLTFAPEIRMISQQDVAAPCTFWTGGNQYNRYVRAEMPATVLGATVADPADLPSNPLSLQRGRVAVWQAVATLPRANLIAQQEQQGILTILESDDDYTTWDPKYARGDWVEHTIDRRSDHTGSVELHRQVAGFVDRVIVTNEELADRYLRFNDDVRVVPNAIFPGDWPPNAPRSHDVLRVGWLMSHAHERVALRILPVLLEFAKRDDVQLYWIGLLPPKELRNRGIKAFAWHDSWTGFRDRICSLGLDVGIAPLWDDSFSRCKSDLKVLEYAMAGAMPLVSDVGPYRAWNDDDNVKTVSWTDWADALNWCADNKDQVRRRADQHTAHILETRQIRHLETDWRNAINL